LLQTHAFPLAAHSFHVFPVLRPFISDLRARAIIGIDEQERREESDSSPEIPFSAGEARLRINEAKECIERSAVCLSSVGVA
jgi:hypothetical protein